MSTWILFVGGVILAAMAPLGRGSPKAGSLLLLAGALTVLGGAIFNWAHLDIVRLGQASVNADRRFDLFTMAIELPVAALALVSLRHFQKSAFWLGWTINLGFGLWLAIIFVWLKFFWHW